MAYTDTNFKTKKALIDALERGIEVSVYQPGPFGPEVRDGQVALEGPHYPAPHTWYASATVRDGVIVGMKGVKIGSRIGDAPLPERPRGKGPTPEERVRELNRRLFGEYRRTPLRTASISTLHDGDQVIVSKRGDWQEGEIGRVRGWTNTPRDTYYGVTVNGVHREFTRRQLVLVGTHQHGEFRNRPGHPQGRGERKGIELRLTRRSGRRRYRSR